MNIKKFHFNCGTLRPYGFFPLRSIPLSGRGKYFRKGLGVIHCLLLDTGAGLVLVDTGYGTGDITHPTRAVKIFNKVIGFANDLEETAHAFGNTVVGERTARSSSRPRKGQSRSFAQSC